MCVCVCVCIYMVHSIGFQVYKNCSRLLKIHYVIAIHLMR